LQLLGQTVGPVESDKSYSDRFKQSGV